MIDKLIEINGRKYYPNKSNKPLASIRLFCAECMGMSRLSKKKAIPYADIDGCTDELCPLFEYRRGKNPNLKGRKTGGNPNIAKIRKEKIKDGR